MGKEAKSDKSEKKLGNTEKIGKSSITEACLTKPKRKLKVDGLHSPKTKSTPVHKAKGTAKGQSGNASQKQQTEENQRDPTSRRIDDHTVNYFKRVEKVLEEDAFDDEESRGLFLKNVLVQLGDQNQTRRLARHRLISQVLERLLELSPAEHYVSIFQGFLSDIVPLCHDRFASHPVQTLLNLIPKYLNEKQLSANTGKKQISEHTEEIKMLAVQFCKTARESLSELIRDTYGSHIISTLIQVLSGVKILGNVTRSKQGRAMRDKLFKGGTKGMDLEDSVGGITQGTTLTECIPTNEDFRRCFHKLGKRILSDDNVGELMCHRNANPVLQVLLLVSHKVDSKLCLQACKIIISKGKLLQEDGASIPTDRAPLLFVDEIGSHLVEKLLHVSSPDVYEQLFFKCFRGNLLALSLHPSANYIVQHLLWTLQKQEQVEAVMLELTGSLEDILAAGHFGVVVKMAEICARFHCQEKEIFKALSSTFHLPKGKESKKEIFRLLITMSTYEIFFQKNTEESGTADQKIEESTSLLTNENINYHGACLAKILFQFKKPTRLVKSLLSLSLEETLVLSKHEHGSFTVEGFLLSETVPLNKKQEFITKIQDKLSDLACSKYGSHVLDKVWAQSDLGHENKIVQQLVKDENTLKGNLYGRIILRNCGIDRLKTRGASWQEKQSSPSKKRKLFEKLFEETKESESVVKKKKKRSSTQMASEMESGSEKANNTTYSNQLSELGVSLGEGSIWSNTSTTEALNGTDVNYSHFKNEIDDIFEHGARIKEQSRRNLKKNKDGLLVDSNSLPASELHKDDKLQPKPSLSDTSKKHRTKKKKR